VTFLQWGSREDVFSFFFVTEQVVNNGGRKQIANAPNCQGNVQTAWLLKTERSVFFGERGNVSGFCNKWNNKKKKRGKSRIGLFFCCIHRIVKNSRESQHQVERNLRRDPRGGQDAEDVVAETADVELRLAEGGVGTRGDTDLGASQRLLEQSAVEQGVEVRLALLDFGGTQRADDRGGAGVR